MTETTTTRAGEIDLTRPDDPTGAGVVDRAALSLGSTLELREVLHRVARLGRGASEARHCSLFLLEGRRLVPTVAVGHRADQSTWRAFRSMDPIHVDPDRWHLLTAGKPVAVEDARQSDLIPRRWLHRFRPGAVVLVPLVAEGHPGGLLAVDWPEPRSFSAEELATLEALGVAAGVAVRNARLFDQAQRRARLQEALTRGAAALASPLEPEVIAERLLGAYTDLIGARLCVIGLLDSERATVTTVAARGASVQGPVPLGEIPDRIVTHAWRNWERAKTPLEFVNEPWFNDTLGGRHAGASWYLLSPLVVEEHTRGCVLLGFERGRLLDAEERSAIDALTGIAGAAVERSVLFERRDRRTRRLDALYRVSAALTEGADADAMVNTLSDLLEGHGISVDSVAFCDRRLAQRLGAGTLTRRERDVISDGGGWEHVADSTAVIPMFLGRRLFGVLRVRPAGLDAEERAFLETLARDLAEVARRDDLRSSVEEAGRHRAVAQERDRLASDLHDTAGQAFVAVGLLARSHAEELAPADPSLRVVTRLAELADRGKWDIDQATRALAFAPAVSRGLVPSLESLARDVQGDSGIAITVTTEGPVRRLDTEVERALFRVAHEAIANAWRHAECKVVRVEAVFGAEVALRVGDDGVGVPDEFVEDRGIEGMRRALKECGGTLRVGAGEGGGTVIEACVPGRPA